MRLCSDGRWCCPGIVIPSSTVGPEKWRKLPTGLTSHFRLFHVAYDSLPTVIDVDVLDANVLLPTVTKPSKHLDLGRIGS